MIKLTINEIKELSNSNKIFAEKLEIINKKLQSIYLELQKRGIERKEKVRNFYPEREKNSVLHE